MLKKLWHDPVWSKVIAGLILAAGAGTTGYFLHWWRAIGATVGPCYTLLLAATSVPNWILFLFGLLSLPTVILLGVIIWLKIFPSKPASPSWQTYTTDLFFGLRWRWKYLRDGQIYDATTFCPHCDFQVYAQNVSAYRIVDHIAFQCESCGSQLGDFQESFASLEDKVKRFIQQKIRNGTSRKRKPSSTG